MRICTIVILNYNESDLNLVNLQTYLKNPFIKYFDIIVADDGSSDKKLVALAEFCEKKKIKFITGKNLGTLGNISRAIKFVHTDKFVLQGGGDKILLEPTLTIAKSFINNSACIVFTKLRYFGKDDTKEKYSVPKCTGIKWIDKILEPIFNLGSSGGTIYPTSTYKIAIEANIHERQLMEDWIIHTQLSKMGIRFIQTSICNYEYSWGGITSKKVDLKEEMERARKTIIQITGKNSRNVAVSSIVKLIIGQIYKYSEKGLIANLHERIFLRI